MSDEVRGIECPNCGCRDLRTTRTTPRSGRIRRERTCRHCGRRIVTVEKPLDGEPATYSNPKGAA